MTENTAWNATGIDFDALKAWAVDVGVVVSPRSPVRPVGGGTQNQMFLLGSGADRVVFRCGPKHPRPSTNDVIRREIRLLTALADTPVPHARLVASCSDVGPVAATPCYLMRYIDSVNAAQELNGCFARDDATKAGLGFAVVDAALKLGAVDVGAVGLAEFGKPSHFLERQVGRWSGELERHLQQPGYDTVDLPHIDVLTTWLENNRPRDWQAGLLHGDFHVANMLFRPDGAGVAAVIDWEMSTVGDPLLDLGLILAVWPDPKYNAEMPLHGGLYDAVGLVPARELVRAYQSRSDRDLSAMPWYAAMAAFKIAVILEGTYARSLAGKASRDLGSRLHHTAGRFLERARYLASIDSL